MSKLSKLYAKIPEVKGCQKGCSDCCGPVPMSSAEAGKVRHLLRPEVYIVGDFVTPTKPNCMDCAYSTPKGCSIYADRPFMCRLFGSSVESPLLKCPHGARPDKPLSAHAADKLSAQYIEMMRREAQS